MKRRLSSAFVLVSLVTVCWSLHSGIAQAFDHAGLARAAVENHIRPGYLRLARGMDALDKAMTRLCQSTSEAELARARAAFREAVTARATMEHIRFGPIAIRNRYERLAFWPDRKGIGRRQIRRALRSKKKGLDNPEALARMSVALQGLTALEVVLFDKSADVLAGTTEDGAFRCRVARAIAKNLSSIAKATVAEWNDPAGYGHHMLTPGAGNPVYLSEREVTLELVQAYTTSIIFVRDKKIELPVGGARGPQPRSVEFKSSASAKAALKGNIAGLEDFYRNGGLRSALTKISKDRVKRGDNNFKLAHTMLGAISLPLVEAVVDEENTDRLITLSLALSGARSAVAKGINQAAGLSLGFNAGDGD